MSAIAIVYTSLVALAQEDMKKLIAYSSVAHMGYVTMGIFAANQQGVDGAIFQMISHGFISGALFLCVGVIYDRMHTREIDAYGGLGEPDAAYALIFMFFTMANVGLPGTSGFVGEFLTLVGIFQVNTWVAAVATSGVILSASYALVALPPRGVWRPDQGKPEIHHRHDHPRTRDLCAAGGDDLAFGRLSQPCDRYHRSLGDPPCD